MSAPKYLCFDTETGGLDPTSTSLLTIGLAIVDADLNITASKQFALKSNDGVYRVTAGALKVNKIDLVQHEKIALPYELCRDAVVSFIRDNAGTKLTQTGYNIPFDQDFIYNNLFSREEWGKLAHYRKMDVCDAIRFLQEQGKLPYTLGSLTSVAEHFGIDTQGAHDALRDVHITVEVLKKIRTL